MILEYGQVAFQLERVYRWECRAVYSEDGVDFLYNHYVIGVQAILHAGATRFERGSTAAISYRELRQHLMQPRLSLVVRLGNEIVLRSPRRAGADTPAAQAARPNRPLLCDAKNGPQPLSFNIISNFGTTKTLVCTYEIETWVNDEPVNNPPLLSNRWTDSRSYDRHGYETRHVRGKAVFRGDYLAGQLLNPTAPSRKYPDDFREHFFFPAHERYRRENVSVTQASDGLSIDYSFSDVEQPQVLLTQRDVQSLTGTWSMDFNWQGISSPTAAVRVSLTAIGNPLCKRDTLVAVLVKVLAGFNFVVNFARPSLYESSKWEVDLWQRRVTCHLSALVSGVFAPIVNLGFGAMFDKRADSIGDVFGSDKEKFIETTGFFDNLALGCYGSTDTAIRMISQALSLPRYDPAEPPTRAQTALARAAAMPGRVHPQAP